jgi:hypothetical protein
MANVLHPSSPEDGDAAAPNPEHSDASTAIEEPTMTSTPKHSPHEEPEVTQEESVPTDGRDTEGEELMKDVGNRKLQDKGSADHKTPEKASGESGNGGESGKSGKQDPA